MKRAIAAGIVACVLGASGAARADDEEIYPPYAEKPTSTTPSKPTYAGLASGGASYRRLFGVPLYTGVASLGFGVDSGHLALYARGEYEGGRTDHGLQIRVIRVGGSAEGIFDRFRIGAGLSVSSVSFFRVTHREPIERVGVGLFGTTSFDIARFDDHALYLGVRGDLDFSASMYGVSAAFGFRY